MLGSFKEAIDGKLCIVFSDVFSKSKRMESLTGFGLTL